MPDLEQRIINHYKMSHRSNSLLHILIRNRSLHQLLRVSLLCHFMASRYESLDVQRTYLKKGDSPRMASVLDFNPARGVDRV